MKRYLILIFALVTLNPAPAVETDKAAHFGVSYAVTTGLYGIYHKALRIPKAPATIGAMFTMILIGLAKEYQDPVIDGRDMMFNTAGALSAGGTISLFEF